MIKSGNKIELCSKCGKGIGGDDFCRYCGAKRSVKLFDPSKMEMQCVYGPPPVERLHTCKDCGFEWTTCMMIDDQRYCPKCGSPASVKELREY